MINKKHNQIVATKKIFTKDLDFKIHPLNDSAQRYSCDLSKTTGMKNIGVHYVVLKPNMTSTEPHFHEKEEEALFVISGNGIANIDNQEIEIEAGDFISYPCNGLHHSITNNSESFDLTYIIFGEKSPLDICVYPKIDKALIRTEKAANLINDYSKIVNIRKSKKN